MELTDAQVRGWLVNIYQPGALGADPVFREVMRSHGRVAEGSDFAVSKDGRTFLQEMVARATLPRPEAPEHIWRAFRVLMLTHFEQHSHLTVARLVGLSSRQLSREKAAAIQRLRLTLENPTR